MEKSDIIMTATDRSINEEGINSNLMTTVHYHTAVHISTNNVSVKENTEYISIKSKSPKRHNLLIPNDLRTKYLLNNPYLCRDVSDLSAFILIHSTPNNFEKRALVRRTMANNTYYKQYGTTRALFLLGRIKSEVEQPLINKEFQQFQDILQGDFLDSYRNLTNKGIMGYRWISENCMNAKMFIKVDEDIAFDMRIFMKDLYPQLSKKRRYLLCNHQVTSPIMRDKTLRWYVTDQEAEILDLQGMKYYPIYCSGFAVIMSSDVIFEVLKAAHFTPFIWIDDVYLYGLLWRNVLQVTRYYLKPNFSLYEDEVRNCFELLGPNCDMFISAELRTEVIQKMWELMHFAHLNRNTTLKLSTT
ncbi:hypothetical protein CHS0354_041498 [Potamilus streckersoni]|uniref:Hexosyltransferase n=1 Tax=Potamilus streckersoni TaxID=2493646 RepID=A0AAE0WA03_9BIVA|nr:hypothetical protein CHS0354_041498 [Potamilus streckersoni]